MTNKSKATRFLIDRIDRKLGSVEKEIKFDWICIVCGVAITVLAAFILGLSINNHPALSIICIMIMLFGLYISYIMTMELIDDVKRKNSEGR